MKEKKIYIKSKQKGFHPKHVCEVGVYLPPTSNVIDFINEGVRTTLVEPDPKSIKEIKSIFKDKLNVILHPVAVFDYDGELELSPLAASTFVSTLTASPALINSSHVPKDEEKFTVKCLKFDKIDDGSIELLSVDTEGCEWYVIKNLKSRPSIISIETHGKYYTNPFIKEILNWIKTNDYKVWYKDSSDTVFVKKDLFDISLKERLQLILVNTMNELIRLKRYIKKKKRNVKPYTS